MENPESGADYPDSDSIADETLPYGTLAEDALPEEEPGQNPEIRDKKPGRLGGELFDWLQTIVSSLILVSLLFSLVARVIGVVGSSMEPTLVEGQKVLISSLFYTPRAGDVVIFNKRNVHELLPNIGPNDEPLVKRIIAVEGQVVKIDGVTGLVFVDGELLDEPYIMETIRPPGKDIIYVVEPGHVFVMGDNRNRSSDSRAIGSVDARYILGRVLLRVWPFGDFGPLGVEDGGS